MMPTHKYFSYLSLVESHILHDICKKAVTLSEATSV